MVSRKGTRKTRTQRDYTLDQRVRAVTAALAVSTDHPMSNASIDAARAVLEAPVSKTTLYRWIAELQPTITGLQPALSAGKDLLPIINDAAQQTISRLDKIVDAYEDQLLNPDIISKSSSRDAAVVMGIARDHRAKEAKIPPEIIARLERIAELASAANMPLSDALDTIIRQIERTNSQRLIDTLARKIDPPIE